MPRLVYVYRQQEAGVVDVYTDTDWAGCPKTRKSTSGGCLMVGGHTVKHWSSTQAGVSLSSGEAEFHGVVKGAGMGLGYQALLRDVGIHIPLRVWTDSSAAIGIASRQGLGKLRHLDAHTLWLQQAVRSGRITLKKVLGTANPADLFTKHSLTREKLLELVQLFQCEFRTGRAATAPTLRTDQGTKATMADYHDDAEREDAEVHNVDVKQPPPTNDDNEDATTPLIMPHMAFTEDELDRLYPSLTAPPDFDAPGAEDCEPTLEVGLREAETIAQAMRQFGRTKRDFSDEVRDPQWQNPA